MFAATFGFSNAEASDFGSLPAYLGRIGAPGCLLNAFPDVILYQVSNGSGNAVVSTNVPAAARLLGLVFYNQGIAFDPATNFLGMTTSNSCAVCIL